MYWHSLFGVPEMPDYLPTAQNQLVALQLKYLYLLDLRGMDHASSPPCTNPQLQAQPVTGIKKSIFKEVQ